MSAPTDQDKNQKKPAPRPTASWAPLAAIGVLAVIMGVSFVLLRPLIVLLPEDQRFTGMTPDQLKALNGQLFAWIGMVFRSWGAFAIGLGTMIAAVAGTAYRRGDLWAWLDVGHCRHPNLRHIPDRKCVAGLGLQICDCATSCSVFMGALVWAPLTASGQWEATVMSQVKTFLGSTAGLIACLVAAALGIYLLVFHLAHVALAVPYLVLLACPLMHFMHRGHHHHSAGNAGSTKS